jgi:hypothetical protein
MTVILLTVGASHERMFFSTDNNGYKVGGVQDRQNTNLQMNRKRKYPGIPG